MDTLGFPVLPQPLAPENSEAPFGTVGAWSQGDGHRRTSTWLPRGLCSQEGPPTVSPSPSLGQDPGRPRGQWRMCPEPCGPGSGADRCQAALSLTLPLAGGRGLWVQGCCRSWLARKGRRAGCGGRQTSSLLGGKCACPCYFCFSPPLERGSLVQTIPQGPTRDGGCPIWSLQVPANHGKNRPQPSCLVLLLPKIFL